VERCTFSNSLLSNVRQPIEAIEACCLLDPASRWEVEPSASAAADGGWRKKLCVCVCVCEGMGVVGELIENHHKAGKEPRGSAWVRQVMDASQRIAIKILGDFINYKFILRFNILSIHPSFLPS
uniref:Uncharacterized protein n=1 Tax=Naja naja TaxID=35670 RepID=A0A8C6VCA4_NAJNA